MAEKNTITHELIVTRNYLGTIVNTHTNSIKNDNRNYLIECYCDWVIYIFKRY